LISLYGDDILALVIVLTIFAFYACLKNTIIRDNVMQFNPTEIPDVILIKSDIHKDYRGEFQETFRSSEFISAGINFDFVQENHAGSNQGVLRGLHYQIQQAQGKLIRVVLGEIYDVAVDLRKNSPTYGRSIGVRLSDQKKHQLWIPPGFAHGYYVISPRAEVCYKVTDYYAPEWERTLLWNDPALKIDWPILSPDHPILSENDILGIPLSEAEVFE
jgi:dTDP-4-dehydrorhamnose 3,5-epimerase